MEKQLQSYIEEIKQTKLDTNDIRKNILRIKRLLDKKFVDYEQEIKAGETSREEIATEFLDEYKNYTRTSEDFQSRVTFWLSQYESCKKIIKSGKLNKNEFNSLINEAKRKEAGNPNETLINSLQGNEQIICTLRVAMRSIKAKKNHRRDTSPITQEDIIKEVFAIKDRVSKELKKNLISSLQDKIVFLEEYGYLDEYIEEYNEKVEQSGLPGIKRVKRNPLPDVEYDGKGNEIKSEELEDMGILDIFESENLEKLSPEELYTLEMFWKYRFFAESLNMNEAVTTIEFLDLWPTLLEKDETAIKDIDEESLNVALKRDLALTYLMRSGVEITPEIEQRYLQFIRKNNMTEPEAVLAEVKTQSDGLRDILKMTGDILLGQSVLINKAKNKEILVKDWGVVEDEEIERAKEGQSIVVAIEMPSFRGPIIISMNKACFMEFLESKDKNGNPKLPKYKGIVDTEYSKSLAIMMLPTSPYFKKYIAERYQQDPSSPLFKQLAVNFAGEKKIKESKSDKQVEERIR